MIGTKHIDPLLCLYLGAYLMCIDNKHLKMKFLEELAHYAKCLMLNSNTMHYIINTKTIMEGKCGQSMQQMLNVLNVNM